MSKDNVVAAMNAVLNELERAQRLHPTPMHSMHEGHSVIREEFEELWDEIIIKHPDRDKVRIECIQLAAMAVRFLVEVVPIHIAAPADAAGGMRLSDPIISLQGNCDKDARARHEAAELPHHPECRCSDCWPKPPMLGKSHTARLIAGK